MTVRGGSGSSLANMTRTRAALSATRKRLGLGEDRGAPQSGQRGSVPPLTSPAPGPPQQAPGSLAPPQLAPEQVDAMKGRVQEFLGQVQQEGATPVPQEAPLQPQPNAPSNAMVTEQAAQMGAAGLGPEQQFYRLSGRLGTPREIAMFRVVSILEQQLQRRPTANELRTALMRPDTIGNAYPTVVEG